MNTSTSEAAVAAARRLQELQRARRPALGDALFADPAWDILLDLFVTYHERRRLSVSAVCIGANVSAATALRYLALLQERGLVSRVPDETDGRRSYVELTKVAVAKVEALLVRYVSG